MATEVPPAERYQRLLREANDLTQAFNAQAHPVPIADVVAAWRRAEAAWNRVQRATVARLPAGVTRCAHGSRTENRWCPKAAVVQVRKPHSVPLGKPIGSRGWVWMPLCATHDDHKEYGQQVRPVSPRVSQ